MGCPGRAPRAPGPMPRALIPASIGTPRPAARRPGCAPRHDASSERPFLHLISDVLARAHRQRENRPRRVLVRLRYEGSAVRDEQVLAVVRLAPAVRHGGLRVVPHARAAQLVDDDAAGGDAVPLFGARHRRERLTPHLRDEPPEGLLHVLDLLVLDRKSTRLNSSHGYISYAVFCLKKKKKSSRPDAITTSRRAASAI